MERCLWTSWWASRRSKSTSVHPANFSFEGEVLFGHFLPIGSYRCLALRALYEHWVLFGCVGSQFWRVSDVEAYLCWEVFLFRLHVGNLLEGLWQLCLLLYECVFHFVWLVFLLPFEKWEIPFQFFKLWKIWLRWMENSSETPKLKPFAYSVRESLTDKILVFPEFLLQKKKTISKRQLEVNSYHGLEIKTSIPVPNPS